MKQPEDPGITVEKAYANAAFCYLPGGCPSCQKTLKKALALREFKRQIRKRKA